MFDEGNNPASPLVDRALSAMMAWRWFHGTDGVPALDAVVGHLGLYSQLRY